jgi:predicted peptidase
MKKSVVFIWLYLQVFTALQGSPIAARPLLSEDGQWLVLRPGTASPALEASDRDKDSVFIYHLPKKGAPERTGFRQNVRDRHFAGNGHLLFLYADKAELLDLKGQTSLFFEQVMRTQILENQQGFVLHYHSNAGGRLEVRSNTGVLLSAVEGVSRFYALPDGSVYAIAKRETEDYEILLLKDRQTEKIYASERKITAMQVDPDNGGLLIFEEALETKQQELLYLDRSSRAVYALNAVLPLDFEQAQVQALPGGGHYFVRLWLKKEAPSNPLVDIWYVNDQQLGQKFFSPGKDVCYLWQPVRKEVQKLGNPQNPKIGTLGNDRYFLGFDPFLLEDYIQPAPLKISIYDRLSDQYALVDTTGRSLFTSADGQYLVYQKDKDWQIYHVPSGSKMIMGGGHLKKPWFTHDGKAVLFEGDGGLWRYDLAKKELQTMHQFEGYQVSIENGTTRIVLPGFNFHENTLASEEKLLLKLYDARVNKSAWLVWQNGRCDTLIQETGRRINHMAYNEALTHFAYTVEDYNLPQRLVHQRRGDQQRTVYQSDPHDMAIGDLKQEIISYTNSDGDPLQGVLFYPLNYQPTVQYPMVVHIYQIQRHLSNRFPYPTYYESRGFNIRLMIENGYFVYLPDILIKGRYGAGLEALDCVHQALDALAGNALIDTGRVGLIGHSFGGYETNFIATQSDRFAAYVAGCGVSDLVNDFHAFNYHFKFPEFIRIETLYYKMGMPFAAKKSLYTRNNPLYHADKVQAPVLLWTGLDDENVPSRHTMAFYLALKRSHKEAIALFYKDEGHALQNPEAQVDLTSKIMDWFNYYLKEDTTALWIMEGVKRGAPKSTPTFN